MAVVLFCKLTTAYAPSCILVSNLVWTTFLGSRNGFVSVNQGIGDLRSIKRWLFSILPETIETLNKQKAQPQNRKILQEAVGPRNGLDKLWRGEDA